MIIIFLVFNTIASATDYYISSSGKDTNNGLSSSAPWKTIAKVNSAFPIMKPADRILFKRGDTFYGTITITKSGTLGHPIVIGAYGTGVNPIISSFSTLSGWTDETGGIYSKTISLESKDSVCVSVNGVNTAIGRFPNTGFNLIDSHSGAVSLTDADLDAAVTNWTGAEVVVKTHAYLIERRPITNHTSHTITFTAALDNLINGYGYFIQNDLRTLDATNEWYYDGSKFYIYGNPSAKTVKVSTLKTGLKIDAYNYITVDNINFQGFGGDGIYLRNAANITIQNCEISFCGEKGISCNDITSGDSYGYLFDNNIISEINDCGIFVSSQFEGGTISNNTITDIGLIPGATFTRNIHWSPFIYEGITIEGVFSSSNTVVEYNSLNNIGYSGIMFTGTNIIVKHNYVNNFCLTLTDGGGIYTSWAPTGSSDPYISDYVNSTDQINLIRKNIVLNGISNIEGSAEGTADAVGIYLDGYSYGIRADSNTIANCKIYSFFINGNRRGIVTNNTFYNSPLIYGMSRWTETGYWDRVPVDIHKDLQITNNIFFAKDISQYCFYYWTNCRVTPTDLSSTIVMDGNYYVRPIEDNLVFWAFREDGISYSTSYFYYTLATWKTFRGQDSNSHTSPISVADTSDIDFYYNATKLNKVITLNQPMVDVKGLKYANFIMLLPFTSAVLMVDPNPANQHPVVTISSPTKGNKYGNPATITIDALASDPDGSISKVEFYNGSVKLVELTSAPYEYTWKDVKAGTYSITAIATDNLNATTTSSPIEFEVVANSKYDVNSNIINLYPNPNDGHFSIEFINPLQNEKSEVVITDLAGKQVYNSLVSKEDIIKQIDLSYIKSGIYFLFIIYKKILVTKKIIIK